MVRRLKAYPTLIQPLCIPVAVFLRRQEVKLYSTEVWYISTQRESRWLSRQCVTRQRRGRESHFGWNAEANVPGTSLQRLPSHPHDDRLPGAQHILVLQRFTYTTFTDKYYLSLCRGH